MKHHLCVALLVVLANCLLGQSLFHQNNVMQNVKMRDDVLQNDNMRNDLKNDMQNGNNNQESGDRPAAYEFYPQTDCKGHDLEKTLVNNAAACAKRCAILIICVAFQFNVNNYCIPKYKCDQLENNIDGNVYTVMNNPDRPAGYELHPYRSCIGNSIMVETSNPAACAKVCASYTNCVAFQFSYYWHCWLNYQCDQMKENYNFNVYIRLYNLDRPTGYQFHPQTDCRGYNLEITAVSNAGECAKKCASSASCVAFQFDIRNNCYLKYQCDQLENNADGNVYIMLYNLDRPAGYEFHLQTFCDVPNLEKIYAYNAAECAKKCASFTNCVAFVFTVENICSPMYHQCDLPEATVYSSMYTVMYNSDGYNCQGNNPCSPSNIAVHGYYYPARDPRKYIECDDAGGCFDLSCPPGLVFDKALHLCVRNIQK